MKKSETSTRHPGTGGADLGPERLRVVVRTPGETVELPKNLRCCVIRGTKAFKAA